MIMAELRGCGEHRNQKICRNRASWTIADLTWGGIYEEDATFNDLIKEVKKPMYKAQARTIWISEATWKLVDQRKTLRQKHTVEQRGIQT